MRRGVISAPEARERFGELRRQLAVADHALRREPDDGLKAPMAQLETVARELGLPVCVSPPVSAGGAGAFFAAAGLGLVSCCGSGSAS